jgi:hypothetical protein
MRKPFWPVVIGAAISAVLGVASSRFVMSTTPDYYRYGAEFFYLASMATLFWRVSRSGGLSALLCLAVAMTVVAVVGVQADELLWTHGTTIGKDFDPLSWGHLTHTVFSLEIIGAWYGLVALAAYAATRVVGSVHFRQLLARLAPRQ